MDTNDLLTTAEAAHELGISRARVHALIVASRLPARKIGRDWTILRSDLALVAHRPNGRPAQSTPAAPERPSGA